MPPASKTAVIGRYDNPDDLDIFQIVGPGDTSVLRMTSDGTLVPTPSSARPPTKTLYVDQGRTDPYVPTGSVATPFKTIMDAVNQVIANGDNSYVNTTDQVPYLINIVGPGVYSETIDLSNPKIVNIYFEGNGAVTVDGAGGAANALTAVGNPGLQVASFSGITFWGGNTATLKAVDFRDEANTGTFLGVGAFFNLCNFLGDSSTGINLKNAVAVQLFGCELPTPIGVTIDNSELVFLSSNISVFGTITIKNEGFLFTRNSRLAISVTTDSTSGLTAELCLYGTSSATTTVDGEVLILNCYSIGTFVVNNGGILEMSGLRDVDSTVTVNAGGTYTPDAFLVGTTLDIAPTVTTTAPAAGAGQALPATPAGYFTILIEGVPKQVAYY